MALGLLLLVVSAAIHVAGLARPDRCDHCVDCDRCDWSGDSETIFWLTAIGLTFILYP